MSFFGQSPLTNDFKKLTSRLLDVSPEVQGIPHLFHTVIWSQKKVTSQTQNGDAWLSQPRVTQRGVPRRARLWYDMYWYGMVWYGMVWYGMVWYGMVWPCI